MSRLDFSRQAKLANPDILAEQNVLVVGCGAIGSQICKMLSLLGTGSITVVDDDVIEEHNVQPQMWPFSTIGQSKVEAIKNICEDLNPYVKMTAIADRWSPSVGSTFDAIFPSVDSIEIRNYIYKYYKKKKKRAENIFDVRIGGAMGLAFSVLGDDHEWYDKTFFDPSEAVNNGCVQPMINPVANITAGLAVMNFVNNACEQGCVPRIQQYTGAIGAVTTPALEEVFFDEE